MGFPDFPGRARFDALPTLYDDVIPGGFHLSHVILLDFRILPDQPDGTYQLRPPLTTEPSLTFSGSDLRAGVRLTLPAGSVGLWAVRVVAG